MRYLPRRIPQGQYVLPRFAADSWVSQGYVIVGNDGGEYSANPADYWPANGSDTLHGAIVKLRHEYLLASGDTIYARRMIVRDGTVEHLRRLSRATERMVVA